MNEQNVAAVLAEVATQLTDRSIGKSDDATMREQKEGTSDAISELIMSARVDREAARLILGLRAGKAPAANGRKPPGRKPKTQPLYGNGAGPGNGIGAAPYSTSTTT